MTASPARPMSAADLQAGAPSPARQRAGPSGQALFGVSADLLAAARALAANADAPDCDVALAPALACVEASLEALADAAQRIGHQTSAEWPTERSSRPMAAGRFDRLADALRSATHACGDARRTTSANR
jgi:hypothetical protein